MPYTLPVSFDQFASNIEVSGYSRDIAKKRENRIKALLGGKFEVLDVFSFGSLPNFTAVKNHADLDIILVLHYGKHCKDRKPSNVLLSVKNALDDYVVKVRRNGQAISLSYQSWPNVDIVPVYRTSNSDGSVNHYGVPNMNTETWIRSRPRAHARKLTERNSADECGSKFKRAIKMAKWWNYENGCYLSSYHIEVMALDTLYNEISDYSWSLYYLFSEMEKKVHLAVNDGLNSVSSSMTNAQRATFDIKLANAVRRLSEARDYANQGKNEKAIEKYRLVFGSAFPAYG